MDPEQLSQAYVELADAIANDFDLLDFLHLLAARGAELLEGAAGVMLADPAGQLRFIAASAEAVRLLEVLQLRHCEGPGLDCFRDGRPVAVPDLGAAAARWPRIASAACRAGFRAARAWPMRRDTQVIGVLNLLRPQPGELSVTQVRIGQGLADAATIGLLYQRSLRHSENLREQLQSALHSRIVVEQAKGKLAERFGVDMDTAFQLLREMSRRGNLRLSRVAQAVIEGGSGPDDVLALLPSYVGMTGRA